LSVAAEMLPFIVPPCGLPLHDTWARNDRYKVNKCRPKVGHSSGETWAGDDLYKVSKLYG